MKSLILNCTLIIAMLGGCRLDPNGLLGNDPSGQDTDGLEHADPYSVCQEQKILVGDIANATGCATPGNLTEFLVDFRNGKANANGFTNEKLVRLVFGKMWDGTFPKLTELQYRGWDLSGNNATTPLQNAVCQVAASEASVRVYECKLEGTGTPSNSGYQNFTFNSMTLGHDTCAAKAIYTAKYVVDLCYDSSFYRYPSAPVVYFNRQPWPKLYLTYPDEQP